MDSGHQHHGMDSGHQHHGPELPQPPVVLPPDDYARGIYGYLAYQRIQSLPEEEQRRIRDAGNRLCVILTIVAILVVFFAFAWAAHPGP